MIDLRSDTVTKPTRPMLDAIAQAQVGDDVQGEDPTVNALEEKTASFLGKEAAVFMPSGTMTNQVAIRVHTEPGDEIITEAKAHVYYNEGGGPAAHSGVSCYLLEGERGIFSADQVKAALRPANVHFPRTRLVCLENTSNYGGGSVWPLETIREVETVARDAGLKMHLDGARLWNAAVASGISEKEIAACFDSVSVCFSKGLGAPVGSALAGTAEFIDRSRRFRKQFGGGMRQAGIIAAGARYALEHHRDRLAEDHANAKKLARAITTLPGIECNPDHVETNIIYIKTIAWPAADLVQKLKSANLLVLPSAHDTVRAVTNLMVTPNQIDQAITIFNKVLQP
jgi:threonine aldolase